MPTYAKIDNTPGWYWPARLNHGYTKPVIHKKWIRR